MTLSKLSEQGHTADALAPRADEGRGKLRKATGNCQASLDPWMSEWGNPPSVMGWYPTGGEPGELKHLSSRRKRKSNEMPTVAASEEGRA